MSAYLLGNAPNLYNAAGSPAGQMGLDGVEYPSSVSGAGLFKRLGSLRVLLVGDSFGQRSSVGGAVSAATVSNGVMTITLASHGIGVGSVGSLAGAGTAAQRVYNTPVLSRIDANNFTVSAPGCPDGAVSAAAAARSGMTWVRAGHFAEDGIFVHLQRRSGYAFELFRNSSQPGYTVAEIVALWDELVTPHLSSVDLVIFQAGFNSFAQSESADTIIAAYQSAITKAAGTPMVIVTPAPVVSGSSADSAAKLETAAQTYWRLKSLCELSGGIILIDGFGPYVNASTGYAATGYIGGDAIHPAAKYSDAVAAQILARIDASKRPARTLVASSLDNVAVTGTNPNIARNGLGLTTAGGSVGPFASTLPADETTGTAGAMSNWTMAINAGSPTAEVFRKPAAAGNAQCIRVTSVAAANQSRSSFALTTSDITLGGYLDILFAMKLRTDFNASNKTPAGQNVRGLIVQLVMVIDGNTYTHLLSNQQGNPTAATYLTSDLDSVIYGPRIPVPTGAAITTCRIDCNLVFDGVGVAQLEMSQVSVRKVA